MNVYKHELSNEINITASAKEKVIGLLADAGDQANAIRIYVYGGGCSGMNYGMAFAENSLVTDSTINDGEMKVVVDPVALGFLTGAEIDYVDEGMSSTFVFNNVFQSVGGSGACGGCGSA